MNRKIVLSIGLLLQPLYLCGLCLILLSYGCNKNQHPFSDPVKDKEKPKDPEKPKPPAKVIMIPSSINSQNLRTEFKYEAETNLLMEIIQSDGRLTKFFYNPTGVPLKYEYYKDNKIQQSINYILNKEGQLYKLFLYDSRSASAGYYAIIYDEEKRITQLKKYGANNLLVEEENISYDNLGNARSIVLTNNGKTTTMNSTYDDRPGIYQNIPYVQLLLLTQQPSRATFSKNNPLQIDYLPIGATGSISTYEYNSNSYPSTLHIKQRTSTETMKITYKTIKPK